MSRRSGLSKATGTSFSKPASALAQLARVLKYVDVDSTARLVESVMCTPHAALTREGWPWIGLQKHLD